MLHLFYLPVVLAAFFLGRDTGLAFWALLLPSAPAVVLALDVNTMVAAENFPW